MRVREKGLFKIETDDIELSKADISISTIKKILQAILKYRHIKSPEIQFKIKEYFKYKNWGASALYNKLLEERSTINLEKSLSYLYPEVAKYWHPAKNHPLLPQHFILLGQKKSKQSTLYSQ